MGLYRQSKRWLIPRFGILASAVPCLGSLPSFVPPTASNKIVGGPRTRTEDPDFGTFTEGQQKYGEQSGGGWGAGAGRGDENDPVPA